MNDIITQNMKHFEAKYQLLKIALIAAYILIPLEMILEFVNIQIAQNLLYCLMLPIICLVIILYLNLTLKISRVNQQLNLSAYRNFQNDIKNLAYHGQIAYSDFTKLVKPINNYLNPANQALWQKLTKCLYLSGIVSDDYFQKHYFDLMQAQTFVKNGVKYHFNPRTRRLERSDA